MILQLLQENKNIISDKTNPLQIIDHINIMLEYHENKVIIAPLHQVYLQTRMYCMNKFQKLSNKNKNPNIKILICLILIKTKTEKSMSNISE